MARPKTTSAVYSRIELNLIAQLREIAFQQKTTISKLIKKAIEYSLTHNILSNKTPDALKSTHKRLVEKPLSALESKKQGEGLATEAEPRIDDPSFLMEYLTRYGVDEAIIQKLDNATILNLMDAPVERLTKLGIPSEIAEEILEIVEDARSYLSSTE